MLAAGRKWLLDVRPYMTLLNIIEVKIADFFMVEKDYEN